MARGQVVRKPVVLWPMILGAGVLVLAVGVAISCFRSGRTGWGWAILGALGVIIAALLWIVSKLPGKGDSYDGGTSGGGGATGSW